MAPPRIFAIGMYNRLYDIQLASLMKGFGTVGIPAIERTFKRSKILKLVDIFWGLVWNVRRYDVVHCQAHSGLIMIAVALAAVWCRIIRKRIVVMYYGGGAKLFFQRWPRFYLFVFSLIHEVVVAGEFMRGVFEELGVKVTVIPHIIDVEKWPRRLRDKPGNQLLWVRHLQDEYNPMMLLEVFKKLYAGNPDLRLCVVGRGKLEEKVAKFIESESLVGVELLGRVSDEKLKCLFAEADFFINTSRIDNQPVSVLEAMSSGVPVVSTDPGGIPDIIESGVNGMLSQEGNSDAMVSNFKRIMENAELYASVSHAGMKSVEDRFGTRKILAHWDLVYRRMGFPFGS